MREYHRHAPSMLPDRHEPRGTHRNNYRRALTDNGTCVGCDTFAVTVSSSFNDADVACFVPSEFFELSSEGDQRELHLCFGTPIILRCCARAARGHAAAPPRSVMKSRRPNSSNCIAGAGWRY